MGWRVGRGVLSPLKKGSGEGAEFFWFNVFKKILRSGQRGAIAHCPVPPPLNTPLARSVLSTRIPIRPYTHRVSDVEFSSVSVL